ncbi:MAG: hypothetical protein JXO72_04050, partial [Vicinamibacteria bacterium]|nr:hypothetical protein [Vicinamibacteria bacterium]
MSNKTSALTAEEMDAMVHRILADAAGSLAPSQIRNALPKAYRPTEEELARRLRSMCASGAVHRWPRDRFGAKAPEDSAAGAIIGTLADRPLTSAGIARIVARKLRGIGKETVAAALKALVAEKRVLRHPPAPRGRTPRFALTAPDPADYLEPGLSRLVAHVAKKGFTPESVKMAIAR